MSVLEVLPNFGVPSVAFESRMSFPVLSRGHHENQVQFRLGFKGLYRYPFHVYLG